MSQTTPHGSSQSLPAVPANPANLSRKRLRCRTEIWLIMLCVLVAQSATAATISELVVFGDTLSDSGNASNATLGFQPGPFYYDGRFSNGQVYAELLASHLGLPAIVPSSSGGSNFAFGGAKSSGTGGLAGVFIEDIDEQVDDFLSRGAVDADALLLMFAGANDLLDGELDVGVPVTNLAGDLQRLISAGARQLIVLNLPPLGLTPRFNADPNQAAMMNAITTEFNAALWEALDAIEATHAHVTLSRFDIAQAIEQLVANPADVGLVNVTDPAALGLVPGDSSYDTSLIASDADRYLFWDDLHPTTTGHAILARQLAAAVPEPSRIALILGGFLGFLGLLGARRRPQPAGIPRL